MSFKLIPVVMVSLLLTACNKMMVLKEQLEYKVTPVYKVLRE